MSDFDYTHWLNYDFSRQFVSAYNPGTLPDKDDDDRFEQGDDWLSRPFIGVVMINGVPSPVFEGPSYGQSTGISYAVYYPGPELSPSQFPSSISLPNDVPYKFYEGLAEGPTNGPDNLTGTGKADTIKAKGGADNVHGKGGGDTLLGQGGNDKLFGDAGKDKLNGGSGKDKLNGGKGNDVLIGGKGADKFVFKPNQGEDLIKDFQNGKDKLDLSAFKFKSKAQALKHFNDAGGANNDTVKFDHKGTEITIKGIDLKELNGADLIV